MDRSSGPGRQGHSLANVREGMPVVDRNGEELGVVERVHVGSSPSERAGETSPNTSKEPDMAREGLWDSFEDAFDPVDQLAEDLRVGLWRSGFIRIKGAGLSVEERYLTPDLVASTSGGKVHLNIERDELVRR